MKSKLVMCLLGVVIAATVNATCVYQDNPCNESGDHYTCKVSGNVSQCYQNNIVSNQQELKKIGNCEDKCIATGKSPIKCTFQCGGW